MSNLIRKGGGDQDPAVGTGVGNKNPKIEITSQKSQEIKTGA